MKRVLIVRPDGIGDFVIFTAVLEEYARVFKGYSLDLLCDTSVKPLAEAMPCFDRIYCVKRDSMGGRKAYFHILVLNVQMFFCQYDIVIYPLYSRARYGDRIVRFIRAKEKIAFDGDVSSSMQDDLRRRNHWFTRIIASDPGECPEIDRNAQFINQLGGNLSFEQLTPRLWFKEEDQRQYDELCRLNGLGRGKYICLFPGAGIAIRHWDVQEWVNLIEKLYCMRNDRSLVFLGGKGDKAIVDGIVNLLGTQAHCINLTGELDLRITAKMIEGAALLVSMETSAVHIAAALGTPNICIIGGGHFGRFYPYGDPDRNRIVCKKMDCFGCHWKCIHSRIRCILEISHEDVFAAAQRIYERFC